jgi:hypothetical protein
VTTDASVYKIVADAHSMNESLLARLQTLQSITDALYRAVTDAMADGSIPEHASRCECSLCAKITEYKEYKWKMTP